MKAKIRGKLKKPSTSQSVTASVTRAALLEGQDDGEFRHMVHNLLAFSARLEHIRSRFGLHIGLTGVQYTILITIRQLQNQEGVGVKSIADHLALSGAFVTIETAKLTELGLVEKQTNPADRRRVLLSPTLQGCVLLDNLSGVQQEINDLLFSPLNREGFKSLSHMAGQLRESAEQAVALSNYLITGEANR